MSIATKSDLTAYGFQAEQFGNPGDWSTASGYLETILADAAAWARPEVGATVYDAAETAGSGSNWQAIRQAEKYYAVAELWRRRAAFIDSAAAGSEGDETAGAIARYETSAERYHQMAVQALARVSGSDPSSGSGVAIGHVQTGPFPEAEA
jgi:hypothetical protein